VGPDDCGAAADAEAMCGGKDGLLLFANKYMAADRMSPYADPHDRSRLMTHKKAAKRYRDEAAKLELELNRARNGRLRFWHH